MFSWDDYLIYAKQIAAGSSLTEADYRTSISRAYYSVFNKCSDKYFFETSDVKPKFDIHKFVIDKFKAGSNPAKSIGVQLDTLRISRVDSDYYKSKLIDKKKMDDMIKLAELIDGKLPLVTNNNFN